jgi:hypothetical protein
LIQIAELERSLEKKGDEALTPEVGGSGAGPGPAGAEAGAAGAGAGGEVKDTRKGNKKSQTKNPSTELGSDDGKDEGGKGKSKKGKEDKGKGKEEEDIKENGGKKKKGGEDEECTIAMGIHRILEDVEVYFLSPKTVCPKTLKKNLEFL